MAEAKTGEEFIKHELDEAIATQQAIVEAERQLSGAHPEPAAKKAIETSLKQDERFLGELQTLGREHGATGKVEEVAGGLKQLMEQTASKADQARSEAYEATAVLLTLKRKQQDAGAAMIRIAREMDDSRMRKAADEFHSASKESAEELSKQLSAFAVKIASEGMPGKAASA